MNKEKEKEAKEREIFCRFATVSKNYEFIENRKPPEPDILAINIQTQEPIRFELVEIYPYEYYQRGNFANEISVKLYEKISGKSFGHIKIEMGYSGINIDKFVVELYNFLETINYRSGKYTNINNSKYLSDKVQSIIIDCGDISHIDFINPLGGWFDLNSTHELITKNIKQKIKNLPQYKQAIPNQKIALLIYINNPLSSISVEEPFMKDTIEKIKSFKQDMNFDEIFLFNRSTSKIFNLQD